MARFNVEMRIDFQGEIEADSAEEAERLAWTSWGDNSDAPITYDSVYSIDVEELEDEDEDEDEREDQFNSDAEADADVFENAYGSED